MSDEEKKAIEDFRKNYENDLSRYDDFNSYTQFIIRRNGTILNLIKKQQEEIEENKLEICSLKNKIFGYKHLYISKDKIKEKINELETLYNCNLDTAMTSYEMFVFVRSYIDKVKNILNELLEDN